MASIWDRAKHVVAQPVGWTARAVGSAQNLLPGQGDSTLNQIGRAITNPTINGMNVLYQGADKLPSQPMSGGGGGSTGVLGASTYDAYAQDAGGAGLGGAPAIDTAYRNDLANKIQSIISAYDSLTSGVDTVANDAINRYNQDYQTQYSDLQNEFAKTGNQLAGMYGARGLADSSYYGNAQDEAKNTYNSNAQSLLSQRDQNLASIGQQTMAAKAGYSSGRQQYADILGNLNSYDQTGLNNLGAALPGAMAGVQQAQAGQGTQADYLRAIQGLPALQNSGASQLQAQLQKLAGTNAPAFAKNQIAQGIINQAQAQDPAQGSYWQDFWQQIMGA